MKNETRERQKQENILNAAIAGAATEVVQRYGEANKQHFVAYSGMDNETGQVLKKGLKQIHEGKIHPDYEHSNKHQQGGYAAEVKDVAKTNAENIINKSGKRKVRTDDIGRVNDPLYDTVVLDDKGNIIKGSGEQMKFLGSSENDPEGVGDAARAYQKLKSKKCEKYFDNDINVAVPSDHYDKIIAEADSELEKLAKQLESQESKGNNEQAQKIRERIAKIKKIKKHLKKSKVSSKEASFARSHPKMSTAIDVAKISHRAGIETAKSGAMIGGSVSIVKNIVAICNDDIDSDEAIMNVAKDTGSAVATGYASGFAGSAIKGAMQNSKVGYVRSLSKTNLPGTLVALSISTAKTMGRYFSGEIDGAECLKDLGEDGFGMINSALFATIGQVAIPIPIVGSMIGGMVGYALSSTMYAIFTKTLEDAKLAHERRIEIEKACAEHIKLMQEYKARLEKQISEYLEENIEMFRDSFSGLNNALAIGDVEWFIDSANQITRQFGGHVNFDSYDEFDEKMIKREAFIL